MPSAPGKNYWEESKKAGGNGSEGPDTREVRDTLSGPCQSLFWIFRSPGSLTGPRI